MQRKNLLELRRQWKTRMYIAILLSLTFSATLISDVQAQGQTVTVRVLIEESYYEHPGCGDTLGWADLYWTVEIDGVQHDPTDPLDDDFEIGGQFEVNVEFAQDVYVSQQNIPIVISEYDSDDDADDLCDLYPGDHRRLYLNLNLTTCQITGDAAGICGQSITITGDHYFVFTISVEEPPLVDGLALRVLHDPIWPQPGDTVTITAEALDGAGNLMTGIVDDIEIWVDNTNAPIATTATTPGSSGLNVFTFNHTPAAGADQILYRCRVNDGGLWVSSGWRIVQIGQPASGRAVPILYTGVPNSRIDIAFIADRDDYTGSNDPVFLTDVHDVIRDGYYAADPFFRNAGLPFLFEQDTINFWIALDTGDAVPYCATCNHGRPARWGSAYSFVDTGAILHTTGFRDFAQHNRRIFSSEPFNIDTILHETGHSPFGLADEYCCDGGYFQAAPNANIYSGQQDCLNDTLAIGVSDACRQIDDGAGNTVDWFRLDPRSTLGNDLMEDSGDHTARPADERRINWLFGECRAGGC